MTHQTILGTGYAFYSNNYYKIKNIKFQHVFILNKIKLPVQSNNCYNFMLW